MKKFVAFLISLIAIVVGAVIVLTPISAEKSLKYQLVEEYGLTQEETAKRIGKSRTAVTNALRLLNLPENAKKMVESGELSAGHAKVLLGIEDDELLEKTAKQVVEHDLSVRDTEKLVKSLNEPKPEPVKIVRDVDHTRALELLVQKQLGRTVKISEKGKKHTVSIGYTDNEDLENLLKLLCGEEILKNL